MKRLLSAILVLFPMLMFAQEKLPYPCGAATKFEVKTERSLPLPSVPPDKGMVIVVRERTMLFNIGVAIDGKWVGATRKDEPNFFYLFLDPGQYKLCAYGAIGHSNLIPGFLTLNVEPNKTYYVEANYLSDWKKGRATVTVLDPEEGSQLVKRGYLAVWKQQ
ncbi:MAG TPA: hypothetical protein VN622_00345 [Clostridia bacterium]|nr:hypothetical protein [Clostridia bacterium]